MTDERKYKIYELYIKYDKGDLVRCIINHKEEIENLKKYIHTYNKDNKKYELCYQLVKNQERIFNETIEFTSRISQELKELIIKDINCRDYE